MASKAAGSRKHTTDTSVLVHSMRLVLLALVILVPVLSPVWTGLATGAHCDSPCCPSTQPLCCLTPNGCDRPCEDSCPCAAHQAPRVLWVDSTQSNAPVAAQAVETGLSAFVAESSSAGQRTANASDFQVRTQLLAVLLI